MGPRYSDRVTVAKPLPALWLISDARNDAALEPALARLPARSGFVFRHYHLDPIARKHRYDALAVIARSYGHWVILSANADLAQEWGADGIYGRPGKLGKRKGLLRLATVHDAREIALANRAGVDAMFLSPVFPTRSHPGEGCLGIAVFREMAARAEIPVIALGGMNAERAHDLQWPRWAAIDGLSV